MDRSPEYVKKCEKATEIQNQWSPNNGDMVVQLRPRKAAPQVFYTRRITAYWKRDEWIFLPRQDDLQEMWGETLPEMLAWFYDFALNDAPGQFSSMEQLWLAFVMHEKYGKRWDAEKKDWVKE